MLHFGVKPSILCFQQKQLSFCEQSLLIFSHVCDLSGFYGNVGAGSVVDRTFVRSTKLHTCSPFLARMTQTPSQYILSRSAHPCTCPYHLCPIPEMLSLGFILGSIMAATSHSAKDRQLILGRHRLPRIPIIQLLLGEMASRLRPG